MNKPNTKPNANSKNLPANFISIVIFWGALWGLEEATLGHLLHLAAFKINIGWFIWFPLAYFFMSMVYKQTGKVSSVFLTAIAAAAVKFVDLFMTANPVIVFCPALSIIAEGFSMAFILKVYEMLKVDRGETKFVELLAINILWRTLYLVSVLILPKWVVSDYPYNGLITLLKFLYSEGIINCVFIYGISVLWAKITEVNSDKGTLLLFLSHKLNKMRLVWNISRKPLFSFILLGSAIIYQWTK